MPDNNNIDPEKIGDAGPDGMPGSDLFTCKFCGTEFERSPSHKHKNQYCSPECKNRDKTITSAKKFKPKIK